MNDPRPRPKKSFGQHFLTDLHAARTIAELATSPPGGTVLEIGAGQGALTRHLLPRVGRLVAIERDRELVPLLRSTFAAPLASGQFELLEADAVSVDWASALASGPAPRVVAGNVPYAITGRLIELAVMAAPRVDGVVFLIQREVADRLVAPPDSDAYGALSVFAQAAFEIRMALSVKRGSFFPPPRVDSAVVVLRPLRPPRAEETPAFRELVHRAFAARRKTLRNAWKGVLGLDRDALEARAASAGVSLDARGETLSVEQFAAVASG